MPRKPFAQVVGWPVSLLPMLVLLACLALVVAGSPAQAVVTRDCVYTASSCPLAEVARQAGVHVGAIDNRNHDATERAALATHFNAVTPENEMKWGAIAPTVGSYDFTDADTITTFAADHDLR